MKSAGKARNNGLYRHIRTSKEIIRNLLNDSIQRVQHFPGCIFVSRELLYFEAPEFVVWHFQPVCIAVRSIPHKRL